MDLDISQYNLMKENVDLNGTLAESIFGDSKDCKVLAFKSKAPAPKESAISGHKVLYTANASAPVKATRFISQKPERVLDAPNIVDDYYLNLIDWGASNVLAIALGSTVYLWNAATGTTSELMSTEESNSVCSVGWTADGRYLGVGLSNGNTQLWDPERQKALRNLKGHSARVGVMSWNQHILSTGSRDTTIINHDVRIAESVTARLTAHTAEVCGLKWSHDGSLLASGANDNIVNIWNATESTPKLSLAEHTSAVKALAWCPWQKDLLASGGGSSDRCIKFWNTTTGACLNSIDTQSQVSSLVWSKDSATKEIVSSHGFSNNQMCVWKYPSLAKVAELGGHSSRILSMAQSPDGSVIASAGADEALRFWKVFDVQAKVATKAKAEVASSMASTVRHIR
eukprot:TRINITY_DN19909_c0_g1_i1.p1 TRINITY_DN19909_c0_g1~~TRINITY_DN19909_c0_g1_i1.p1  ORF type:complete len:424 (+),score=90.82 TRINITY_DN19909_c0_g1_i1:78-1274(+)